MAQRRKTTKDTGWGTLGQLLERAGEDWRIPQPKIRTPGEKSREYLDSPRKMDPWGTPGQLGVKGGMGAMGMMGPWGTLGQLSEKGGMGMGASQNPLEGLTEEDLRGLQEMLMKAAVPTNRSGI